MWGRRQRMQVRHKRSNQYESVREVVKKHSAKLLEEKSERMATLKKQVVELAAAQKRLIGRKRIREKKHLSSQMAGLEHQITQIESDRHLEEFVELARPLVEEKNAANHLIKQQQQALFVNIFQSELSVPTFLAHETCIKCQSSLTISATECKQICGACGTTKTYLYCSADYINDEINKTTGYERAPLYKKYLEQFHEATLDPPSSVLSLLYKELSKVHMMIRTKIKPTPISQILRLHGMHCWSHMSQRICKILNAEMVPKLSSGLIGSLVNRFSKVNESFAGVVSETRKKILNFEYLTRQFLMMEDRLDLADCFSLHKTKEVLRNADKTLAMCCDMLIQEGYSAESWKMVKSC